MRLHRIAPASFAALLLVGSCVDGDAPTAPAVPPDVARLALVASWAPAAAMAAALPINRIRATALRLSDGEVLDRVVLDVDPEASSWNVQIDVRIAGPVEVEVLFELIHVDAGGRETVQFSGRTGPIALTPGTQTSTSPLALVRGPPDNLKVTGVEIAEPLADLIEGKSAGLSASVAMSDPSLHPTVFWTSLDPTVATTVGSEVTALLPGRARIVATAGALSDTALLSVLPRPVGVVVTPDSSDAVGLGVEVRLAGAVVDPRGDVIEGQALRWRAGESGVLESLGEGRFRTLAAGRGVAVAQAAADTTLADHAVVRVRRPPTDLAVSKTVERREAFEGDEVAFRVTVANVGDVAAVGVRVADSLPEGLEGAAATASQGGFSGGVWSVGDLAAGAEATLDLRTRVAPGTRGRTLTNVARLLPLQGQEDSHGGNDRATASVGVERPLAELAVAAGVSDPAPSGGDTITYRASVTNNGPRSAPTVVLDLSHPDTVDLDAIDVAVSQGRLSADDTVWDVGSLEPGATAHLSARLVLGVGAGGQSFTVSVASRGPGEGVLDPNGTNDAATTTVVVAKAAADLAIALSSSDAAPTPGDTVTITAVVSNAGPRAAPGVFVALRPPDSSDVDVDLADDTVLVSQGTLASDDTLWSVGGLAPGASATLTASLALGSGSGGDTLVLVMLSLGPGGDVVDPNPLNDTASAVFTVAGGGGEGVGHGVLLCDRALRREGRPRRGGGGRRPGRRPADRLHGRIRRLRFRWRHGGRPSRASVGSGRDVHRLDGSIDHRGGLRRRRRPRSTQDDRPDVPSRRGAGRLRPAAARVDGESGGREVHGPDQRHRDVRVGRAGGLRDKQLHALRVAGGW